MLALIALLLIVPPLIGAGVAGRARTNAMQDAQRQCQGYW